MYVYEVVRPDGTGGDRFEMLQSMKEAALLTHPLTGEPVRRVILPPNLGMKHTSGQEKRRLENKNVEKAGFTKYERDKLTGTYHRVAGKNGPETFRKPD